LLLPVDIIMCLYKISIAQDKHIVKYIL